MKILFVCKGNIFRSQIAEVFFKKKCPKHEAKSAGTIVPKEDEGEKLSERNDNAKFVIKAMKEEGFDVGKNKRKDLTPELVEWADKVICMAQKETIPNYLLNSAKMEYWKVEDSTSKSDYEFFLKSREKKKKRVDKLAQEIC